MQILDIPALISEAERVWLRFFVRGGEVHYRGPRGELQGHLLERFRQHKTAVRDALSSRPAPTTPCASEISESAAIISVGSGFENAASEARALRHFGYDSY